LIKELNIPTFVQIINEQHVFLNGSCMKNIIALFVFAIFTVAATASSAPTSDAKKGTKTAVHKDCKGSCCDMKSSNAAKKSGSKSMNMKKDEAKKEPEKK